MRLSPIHQASLLAPVLAIIASPLPGLAQSPSPAERADAERRERQRELAAIRADLERAGTERIRIEGEIAGIRADRAALIARGIETAAKVRSFEGKAAETEERLAALDGREAGIRASLEARRDVIAKVLASLQRMGRRPPPALLVGADDVLRSVRTAMLLGTLVPEMREAARVLVNDLEALSRVKSQIAGERDTLRQDMAALDTERIRLEALAEARQKQMAESEQSLGSERARSLELARQADNLELLISRMETEIAAAQRAAEAARTTTMARTTAPGDRRQQMATLQSAGRISPLMPFEQTRGRLPMPVLGVRLREFGGADGLGGTERGQSIATRAGASVTAPSDGWVVYSGPFRTYGQLLILNAGDGYHVVLAGMDRITVDLGQFVLAGEPVGVMGDAPPPAAAVATGSSQPVLYVEFRKDGSSIDPAPWWVPRTPGAQANERVRG